MGLQNNLWDSRIGLAYKAKNNLIKELPFLGAQENPASPTYDSEHK